ncbi:hypothetical protein [Ruegeria sp. HKCCSP351]|nr:hypothetical protein [Ruegeria sp. HKCCSP351]
MLDIAFSFCLRAIFAHVHPAVSAGIGVFLTCATRRVAVRAT